MAACGRRRGCLRRGPCRRGARLAGRDIPQARSQSTSECATAKMWADSAAYRQVAVVSGLNPASYVVVLDGNGRRGRGRHSSAMFALPCTPDACALLLGSSGNVCELWDADAARAACACTPVMRAQNATW